MAEIRKADNRGIIVEFLICADKGYIMKSFRVCLPKIIRYREERKRYQDFVEKYRLAVPKNFADGTV